MTRDTGNVVDLSRYRERRRAAAPPRSPTSTVSRFELPVFVPVVIPFPVPTPVLWLRWW
jgi:hypothetical protein